MLYTTSLKHHTPPALPEPRHVKKKTTLRARFVYSHSSCFGNPTKVVYLTECTFRDIHHLGLDGYFDENNCHESLQACLTVRMGHSLYLLCSFLAVNGGYSDWKPYGICTKTCGGGVQTRKRTCTNPPPSNGGKDCSGLGPKITSRECNNKGCPGKMEK